MHHPVSSSIGKFATGVGRIFRKLAGGQRSAEIILYLVLWAILFAIPVVSDWVADYFLPDGPIAHAPSPASPSSSAFDFAIYWEGILNVWELLSMFCLTFFVHNFLIAPLLVYHNRKWMYTIATGLLMASFTAYQLNCRPHGPEPDKRDRARIEMKTPPLLSKDGRGYSIREKHFEPPQSFGGPDSVAFIIMTLLLGLNIGTKSYFKSLDDKNRLKQLEQESLNRQLEYLKYQINPHFFMNTLNNIHALVDIDTEQTKYTIEVLSKLMRYVLYEGNKTMAPLQKELDFIRHYVALMRIRFIDRVSISVQLPSSVPDVQVPSLLFTTYVENAFKHGISYQKKSFVEVSLNVDEAARKIIFCCNNSLKPKTEEKPGKSTNVGLRNSRKRLQLLYGDQFRLETTSDKEVYRLLLTLPFKHNKTDNLNSIAKND